jgi:hypothetical protein
MLRVLRGVCLDRASVDLLFKAATHTRYRKLLRRPKVVHFWQSVPRTYLPSLSRVITQYMFRVIKV